MDKEVSLLLNILDHTEEKQIRNVTVWEGKSLSHSIYIAKCGIGKVNAAINTMKLIEAINPQFVINSGVAGGAGLKIGSVLLADKVAYHDVWCGPGTLYGQADGCPRFFKPDDLTLKIKDIPNIHTGLICSGDKFISSAEEIAFIRAKFPEVKAVDMESAAIAQTCFLYGTPFAIIRVVSDTPGEGENISQYKDFWSNAPLKTFEIISLVLKSF